MARECLLDKMGKQLQGPKEKYGLCELPLPLCVKQVVAAAQLRYHCTPEKLKGEELAVATFRTHLEQTDLYACLYDANARCHVMWHSDKDSRIGFYCNGKPLPGSFGTPGHRGHAMFFRIPGHYTSPLSWKLIDKRPLVYRQKW
eukprot:Sspe_Gene.109323::Locus_89266_Transcript_1_1_Confidence_1.000_Length_761::g.109323::m.109323